MLGHWVEAYTDFATALKIDYDDNVNEWMKEIEPNVSEPNHFSLYFKEQLLIYQIFIYIYHSPFIMNDYCRHTSFVITIVQ